MANAVIDETDAMDRMDGDRDMFEELLDLFREHGDGMTQMVRDALAARDCQLLTKAAHTLKGALANISAKSAQAAAYEIELAAKQEDILTAGKAVETLLEEMNRLKMYLAETKRGSTA